MELVLKGLHCAHCANTIENTVKDMEAVKQARLDFVSQTLVVELNDSHDERRVHKMIQTIVQNIEPDVLVEPKTKGHEHEHEHDHGIFGKEKIILIAASVILTGIGIFVNFPPIVNFIIFFAAYLLVGYDIIARAFQNCLRGRVLDENFLMTIATFGAFMIGEFTEAVAVMIFYKVGEYFQDMAVNRSRRSITALMDIRPDFANLIVGNESVRKSPEDIFVEDLILVKPGEKIPLDGIVIDGHSLVDVSALTGESVPRPVKPGDDVLSGSINKNGVLTVRVTKLFGESTVSKILELVQNVSSRKANTENFITKFAKYYTPIVVLVALGVALLPPFIVPQATFGEWFYRALVFLVISCPCALVISIPLTFFSGIGSASKKGILIKGSNFLEALQDVSTVVFDKTGTVTKGSFRVTNIMAADWLTKEMLLETAAYAESLSTHPIAVSIVKEFGRPIAQNQITEYEEIEGFGVCVQYNGQTIIAGNAKLMEQKNISGYAQAVSETAVQIAIDNRFAGCILVEDEIKSDAPEAIAKLKQAGVSQILMLTGDNQKIAEKVATRLGMDRFYAELLPHEKVAQIEKLIQDSKKKKVLFVGDGINDAPVLTRADIGVAMGGVGSDAAIEAADIVIMTDEPSKLVDAIQIAKRTRRIILQNIVLILLVKLGAMTLGVFGVATIWAAVVADVGVALVTVLNSIRGIR